MSERGGGGAVTASGPRRQQQQPRGDWGQQQVGQASAPAAAEAQPGAVSVCLLQSQLRAHDAAELCLVRERAVWALVLRLRGPPLVGLSGSQPTDPAPPRQAARRVLGRLGRRALVPRPQLPSKFKRHLFPSAVAPAQGLPTGLRARSASGRALPRGPTQGGR